MEGKPGEDQQRSEEEEDVGVVLGGEIFFFVVKVCTHGFSPGKKEKRNIVFALCLEAAAIKSGL